MDSKPLNRRQFLASSTAATLAMGTTVALAAPTPPRKAAALKLGCQSAPTTEAHLKYLARFGVRHICGYPQIESEPAGGRLYATSDELNRMKDLAAKSNIEILCVGPPFLESSFIDREKHPAVMLAQSPERDRDIEALQTYIRNCALAGIPSIKYNMSILGVIRSGRKPGRGDESDSVWNLQDALAKPDAATLTRAGHVNAARRLHGHRPRARHRRWPQALHHHQGEPVPRPQLLPGHRLRDARQPRQGDLRRHSLLRHT